MHAPSWACRALYDFHPQLRLAWHGRPPEREGEINPGKFALVQLYHYLDVGPLDDSFTAKSLWGTVDALDAAGEVERVRCDYGPLFSRDGVPGKQDFVWGQRYPMLVAHLEVEDVFSGHFLTIVKQWAEPAFDKWKRHQRERMRGIDRYISDKAAAAVDRGVFESGKTGAIRHGNLAKRHSTWNKEVDKHSFENRYGRTVPKEAPKSKYVANKKSKTYDVRS